MCSENETMSTKTKSMRWHVHDGRDRVGNVELHKDKFVAIDTKNRVVGRFATLHEAMSVFTERRRSPAHNKESQARVAIVGRSINPARGDWNNGD
jgi:hypothetical protein